VTVSADDFHAAAWSWVAHLRAGGSTPWAHWVTARHEPASPGALLPGAAELELVRRLNRRLKAAGLPSEEYRRLVRELVVHQTLAQRPGMAKVTLPPAAFPWADEVADEWIEWIVGSGIDVIGDVEDLRPVPPAPGTPWANPDRPRRVEMVDAALDAIVALALEAANRPDPHEQITARIGRAARRLRGQ
jgi:hypothetical protein